MPTYYTPLTDGQDANAATFNAPLEALDAELVSLSGDISTLQTDLTTAEGNITSLQGDITTIQGNITSLQGDIGALQTDITATQGNITTLQSDIGTLEDLLDGTAPVIDIDIDSGSIDGTVIGANSAAAGIFTSLTTNSIAMDRAAGSARQTIVSTNGNNRWAYGINGAAEAGGNVGSDFFINRYADNGAFLGTALSIPRNTGRGVFTNGLTVNGGTTQVKTIAIAGDENPGAGIIGITSIGGVPSNTSAPLAYLKIYVSGTVRYLPYYA